MTIAAPAVPHIEVQPRVVAAPWELAAGSVHRIVGREDDVQPEPGPLAAYRSVFPERRVVWSRKHQLFEIRQQLDGEEETRIELLYFWDEAPDPITGEERSDEEIAEKVESNDLQGLVRRFRPFDHAFVQQRLRERMQFHADGVAKYNRRIMDRNLALRASKARGAALGLAHAMGEIRTWLPVLAEYQATGRYNPGARTPVIRTGIDLTAPRPTAPPAP